MSNPYKVPESQLSREVGASSFATLLVALVVVIHFGYIFLYILDAEGSTILGSLKAHSFNIFMLCMLFQGTLAVNLKFRMDSFSRSHPRISDQNGLESLKSIIRINMYSALLYIPVLLVSALTGVMSVLPFEGVKSLTVMIMGIGVSGILHWVKLSETIVKNIRAENVEHNQEIESLIHCWFGKALPNF